MDGIGPETADSMLLYAGGQPVFVVDAYTQRVFRRLGLGPQGEGYGDWQRLFCAALPADAAANSDRAGGEMSEVPSVDAPAESFDKWLGSGEDGRDLAELVRGA